MRIERSRRSQNIEDRRGMSVGRGGAIGGGLGLIILLLGLVLGVDPSQLLQGGGPTAQVEPGPTGAPDDPAADFVAAVLGETEDTWSVLFREQVGQAYQAPRLILFSGQVESACGMASSAVGPFYCPADANVYIDLSFYDDLKNRFGAPGDFAQAYVIAHEVGHHVQNLLGTSGQVSAQQRRVSEAEANQLSVRLELQADCYAGVWAREANAARQILETGDVEEGLNAASAIGDDRLQRQAQGYVVPESFTHGTSAQRVRWFERGMATGRLDACDTFRARQL